MPILGCNKDIIISFKPDLEVQRQLENYKWGDGLKAALESGGAKLDDRPLTLKEFREWHDHISKIEHALFFPAICAPARTDFMKAAYHLPALGVCG